MRSSCLSGTYLSRGLQLFSGGKNAGKPNVWAAPPQGKMRRRYEAAGGSVGAAVAGGASGLGTSA
jgi:hypothetical protein